MQTSVVTVVLAHQGGWDEALFVALPMAVLVGLLWLAQKRAADEEGVEQEGVEQEGVEQEGVEQGSVDGGRAITEPEPEPDGR